MPEITQTSIKVGDSVYDLIIQVPEVGAQAEVVGRVYRPDGSIGELIVGVNCHYAEGIIEFALPGSSDSPYFSIRDVGVGFGPDGEDITPTSDNDGLYDAVDQSVGQQLSDLINDIPLGDPLLCLMRAGLTTIAGQLHSCMRQLTDDPQSDADRGSLYECLKANVKGIAWKILWRIAKCMFGS